MTAPGDDPSLASTGGGCDCGHEHTTTTMSDTTTETTDEPTATTDDHEPEEIEA
jgi:hypothetical protein